MLHQHTVSDAELNLDNGGYTSIDAFITPPYTRRLSVPITISSLNIRLHCVTVRHYRY